MSHIRPVVWYLRRGSVRKKHETIVFLSRHNQGEQLIKTGLPYLDIVGTMDASRNRRSAKRMLMLGIVAFTVGWWVSPSLFTVDGALGFIPFGSPTRPRATCDAREHGGGLIFLLARIKHPWHIRILQQCDIFPFEQKCLSHSAAPPFLVIYVWSPWYLQLRVKPRIKYLNRKTNCQNECTRTLLMKIKRKRYDYIIWQSKYYDPMRYWRYLGRWCKF